MKLKGMKLKNFGKFNDFEIEYDGQITRLCGLNGAGKTTIGLTGIWAGLKGIAERSSTGSLVGERFRFIGTKGKTANIEISLIDEKQNIEVTVKNVISKSGNKITFEANDGKKLGGSFLTDLIDVAFMSAKNFTQKSSKEQALLLGIDTLYYDNKILNEKANASEKRAAVKATDAGEEPEKVEVIDVTEVIEKKTKAIEFNQEQQELLEKIKGSEYKIGELCATEKALQVDIELLKEKIEEKRAEVKTIKERIQNGLDYVKTLDKPEELIDITQFDNKIAAAAQSSEKANEYKNWVKKNEQNQEARKELEKALAGQKKAEKEKLDYVKGFKLPFKGLSINEKGELMLDDRPIKDPYYSRGELEVIVAKLHAAINPQFKVRFIDDLELIDEKNQKKLIDYLIENDFQIITAEVGQEKGQDYIELRECSVANGEENKEELF